MARLMRSMGPLLAFLFFAGVLVGGDGADHTPKKLAPAAGPQTPSKGPRTSEKETPPSPPHRRDAPAVQPAVEHKIVEHEVDARSVLREALKATVEARRIIVGNLANANTPGYKRQIVSFATVLEGPTLSVEELAKTVAPDSARRMSAVMSSPHTDVRPGKIRRTDRALDVAIEGAGYFEVAPAEVAAGPELYCTRCGRFELDNQGRFVLRGMKRDWLLIPITYVPDGMTKIDITSGGLEYATVDDDRTMIGELNLHSLPADCNLTPCGDSVFLVRFNCKRRSHWIGNPGIQGRGELRQGCLEESNVDPQQELDDLQRLQQHADALEQAARLLHPDAKPPMGSPERSPQ
jgi:flagellar basal-body rod protein FlgG